MQHDRFEGRDGKRRLFELIYQQEIIENDRILAKELQKVLKPVVIFEPGDEIIRQGDEKFDIWLILIGSVTIYVNGRIVASRQARTHVGEMALLDYTESRCASVRADTQVVAGEITDTEFRRLAKKYPKLWISIARKLVSRLHESNNHLKPPNDPPRIFIGSSKEDEETAKEFSKELGRDHTLDVTLWTSSRAFSIGRTIIENLENQISSDFALFVLGENDRIEMRGRKRAVPRDNVIFELGMFMGALGRERTFVVLPPGTKPKLPSDIHGLTLIVLDNENSATLIGRIKSACDNKIKTKIHELGPK